MKNCCKITPSRRVLTLTWSIALLLAIVVQRVLNVSANELVSFVVQPATMIVVTTVVYVCRCRCCCCCQEEKEEEEERHVVASHPPIIRDGQEQQQTQKAQITSSLPVTAPGETEHGVVDDEEGASATAPSARTGEILLEVGLEDDDDDEEEGTVTLTTYACPSRVYFLDNCKIFLTAVVVTHHVGCAFGACGEGSWFLIIGNGSLNDHVFHWVTQSFVLLNQAYFMPLFFLISAYFTPSSYQKRKGQQRFLADKRKRIWLPAMVVTFTVNPVTLMVGQSTAGQDTAFIPIVGHCWYLFWLLLLWLVYSTFCEAKPLSASSSEQQPHLMDEDTQAAAAAATTTTTESATSLSEQQTRPPLLLGAPALAAASAGQQQKKSFPRTRTRFLYGLVVCGFAMLIVVILSAGKSFWTMPMTIGSLTCNMLLFAVGIQAAQNGWFDSSSRPIAQQLDMPVWTLRLAVVIEGVALIALFFAAERVNEAFYLLLFAVAGVFCVDMSLAVLQILQQYADWQTRWTTVLSEAAYTVYLIHPLIVTGTTAVFVRVYNNILYNDDIIQFDPEKHDVTSSSMLNGPGDGSLHLSIGFVLVGIASHLLCWPLAWCIRRLPGLNQVL